MQESLGIAALSQNDKSFTTERGRVIAEALEPYRAGLPADLVQLTERQVFPYLIPTSIRTGRDSRRTGELLGRPAPVYVKNGRSVRYRLQDVLNWLADGDIYSNTAEALHSAQTNGPLKLQADAHMPEVNKKKGNNDAR